MSQPLRVLQQEQLSSEATQLAAQYGLGAATADYKVVLNKEKRTYIVIGIIGAIVFGVLAAASLSSADNSSRNGLLLLVFALLSAAWAINYGSYPMRFKTWHIYTCDHGFLFTKKGKVEVFRWEQIDSLLYRVTQHKTYGMNTGMTHKYTVRRSDGTTVILDNKFENVGKLGEAINEAIIRVKMPQAIAAFMQGSVLNFGPVSISQQGIFKGQELLPWDQAKRVYVASGYFIVNRDKKMLSWANIPIFTIPNVFLLIALINHLSTSPKRTIREVDNSNSLATIKRTETMATKSLPAKNQIPETIAQQALAYKLGTPVKIHKTHSPLYSIALILGSILVMAAIMAIILFLNSIAVHFRIVYIIVLAPLFVLIYAVRSLITGSMQAYIYTEGFLRARGKNYDVIRWEQIESIWYKRGTHNYGPRLTVTLRLDDGKVLKFDDTIGFVDALFSRIQDHVTRRQLPQKLIDFQRKQVVTFGKINVESRGINNGKELVPWDQIDKLDTTEKGLVVVIKSGHPLKWSPVKAQDTPNLLTLIALVDIIVKERMR